jgi:hypothetical protein
VVSLRRLVRRRSCRPDDHAVRTARRSPARDARHGDSRRCLRLPGAARFNAAEGLLALGTSILGATAGTNLSLLVLDLARDRREREHAAARHSDEALEVRPSTG